MESNAKSVADASNSHIASKLNRLAELNPKKTTGPGIQAGHFVPLCQYHNRRVAAELCDRLRDHGIGVQTKRSRMFVEISVEHDKANDALRALEEFQKSHTDTHPKKFSRDFDMVFLIAFLTTIAAGYSFLSHRFNWHYPIATFVSGASICIVLERWHRRYRYQLGMHFMLIEILGLTTIIAINCAIWRSIL